MKFSVLLLTALCVLMMNCSTSPPIPVVAEPIVAEIADLKITLRFVDKETLINRHGYNDARRYSNPYYGYPALITKVRLMVFEFTAETVESDINFSLDDIYLEIDHVQGKAKSRPYLRSIWSIISYSRKKAMDLMVKKTLLKRKFTVTPDVPVSGYLVFGENYPVAGGNGLIEFGLSTPSGDRGSLEIPILFSADGMIDDSSGGGGIFDE